MTLYDFYDFFMQSNRIKNGQSTGTNGQCRVRELELSDE